MTGYRYHLKLWAIWTLSVSLSLMANPWGKLGWVELTAALSPLVMVIEPRVSREPALAIGIPILTLMWLGDPTSTSIWRLLIAWLVFAGGVLLAARMIESQSELEAVAGQVAFGPPNTSASLQFEVALERELGRARRHEHSFAVLSAEANLLPMDSDASGLSHSEIMRFVADNRARLELCDFLVRELHIYAEVAVDGSRVLALVPEIESDALTALLGRLKSTAENQFDFDVQIGASSFPLDAISGTELITLADRDRKASKLRSLPEPVVGIGIDEGSLRSPDVQG